MIVTDAHPGFRTAIRGNDSALDWQRSPFPLWRFVCRIVLYEGGGGAPEIGRLVCRFQTDRCCCCKEQGWWAFWEKAGRKNPVWCESGRLVKRTTGRKHRKTQSTSKQRVSSDSILGTKP
ncbi:hypothetical protein [Pasteuria penetrans]|uniref:hypothetical protein n=1 Tax=Pasteuria penetrans TaxID=86005 RepID=UPI001CAA609D|nr:hypothetical protein [Pasteuria penetrans]